MPGVLRLIAVFLAVLAVVNAETTEDKAANPGEVAAESDFQDLNEGLEDVADQVENKGTKEKCFELILQT